MICRYVLKFSVCIVVALTCYAGLFWLEVTAARAGYISAVTAAVIDTIAIMGIGVWLGTRD